MVDLARRNNFPWDAILGSEIAGDFKPKPRVYLAACEAFDLPPGDCMMVAAHSSDLSHAAKSGLRTGHIARPNEHGPGKGEAAADRAGRCASAPTWKTWPPSWGLESAYRENSDDGKSAAEDAVPCCGRKSAGGLDPASTDLAIKVPCRVAQTGNTTGRPRNSGIDPITSSPATINPHSAMVNGFATTARSDVSTATTRADLVVEQQGERDHADHQHGDGEQQSHAVADQDQLPARGCGEQIMDELADRRGRGIAEIRHIDGIGHGHPDQEYRHQQNAKRNNGADRRRAQHIEGVGCRNVDAGFPPPAQFIEANRRKGADQGKTGRQRKQQRQECITQGQAREHNADHGIHDTEKDGVARHGGEVVVTLSQGIHQVCRADAADDRICRTDPLAPTRMCDCAMACLLRKLRARHVSRLSGRRPSRRNPD